MSYYDEIKDDRDEWRRQFCYGRCMICDWFGGMLDCHEIVRRSQAARRWGKRANYLAVCRRCHEGSVVNMPLSMQLAHKLLHDPDHFDLYVMEEIVGRHLSLRDVVANLKHIM